MEMIWNLFVELRKEVLEAQKIRAQVLGFKFTFVTAAMGIICANLNTLSSNLLVIPALAAIFLDFLIYSYSFSIKRIGCYIEEVIEPELKKSDQMPQNFTLWQEYLKQPKTKQYLSAYGNIGVTALAVISAIIGLLSDFSPRVSPLLIATLIVFVVIDIKAYREPRKLRMLIDKN